MIVYYAYIQHPTQENKIKCLGHIDARNADHARAIAWSNNRSICRRYVTELGGILEVEAQGGTVDDVGIRYNNQSLTGY